MRRRPQSWLLIILAAVFVGLIYGGMTIGTFFASETNAVDLKKNLALPDIRDFGLAFNSLFGGVMLAIFAAGLIGNEYSWNTVRPLLARARSRAALVTAKLSALLIYAIIFTVVLAALTVAMSLVASLVAGSSWGFSSEALLNAVWYTVGLLVVNLPYLALAFLAAMWAKSNAAGIGVALGVSFLEPALWPTLGLMSDRFKSFEKGGISYNTMRLLTDGVSDSRGWIAAAILLVYTVIFVALTYRIFLRRDVTSG